MHEAILMYFLFQFLNPSFIINKHMPNSDYSDLELLNRILYNDEKAFNLLFERHWLRVYAVSFRYVKDEELALEIAHDIFLNIWNKRHSLNISSFKSYVITSASYHGIRKNQQKKAIPLKYVESYEAEGDGLMTDHPSVANAGDEKMLIAELDQKVRVSLEELPLRCREIYLLSRQEHLSITEISEKLSISKRTVENQLTIALKHLRTMLKYTGVLFF